MHKLTRREFVKTTGLAGAALLAPTARVLGANDDVRVAIIGVGGKGGQHVQEFRKIKGVRVVALCDPDSRVLARRVQAFEKESEGAKVDGHTDFRQVLERSDVDAVVIATPNHWHALLSIYACQAGKDVYVEKPVSHTVWEGRQIVEAARKYSRIVQGGTQNRSDGGLMEFYPYLHEGNLGKITLLRGLCYRDRTSIGKRETPLAPPTEVDYNLWLGPAQDLPILRSRFHYDWHWVWNTGNGDIGNQGPHETDLLLWAMGDKGMPKSVFSFGGRFGWGDAGETPNMQVAAYDWNGIPVFFEVRNMWLDPERRGMMPNYRGSRVGVVISCEGGSFVGGRGGGWVYDLEGKRVRQFRGDGGGKHAANFIDAIRSRKQSDLRAPIEESHRSSSVAHLANISYRLGKEIPLDDLREQLKADTECMDAIARYSEHLAAWKVDLAKEPWTFGPVLRFDAETERFTGDFADAANALLHREDRAPFVVPKTV